jgi:hypothetical protein
MKLRTKKVRRYQGEPYEGARASETNDKASTA